MTQAKVEQAIIFLDVVLSYQRQLEFHLMHHVLERRFALHPQHIKTEGHTKQPMQVAESVRVLLYVDRRQLTTEIIITIGGVFIDVVSLRKER